MKDYSLDKEQQKEYILDFQRVQEGENEAYRIKFADGKEFGYAVVSDVNYEKLENIQEQQAANGVANKSTFNSRKTKAGIKTIASAAASAIGGAIGTSIVTSSMNLLDGTGITFTVGIGVITILGTIPAFAKFMKESAKVKELDTIEYRDENQAKLSQLHRYANSLNGLPKRLVRLIEENDKPFSILNIDKFSKEDLEAIIDNMEREDKTGLQYSKRTK